MLEAEKLVGFDLLLGQWDRGIDCHALLFQFVRGFDALVKERTKQHQPSCSDAANQCRHDGYKSFPGLNWRRLNQRLVDDSNTAYGAGLENAQLLHLVEQPHIDLLRHFHIPHEAKNFLLGFW